MKRAEGIRLSEALARIAREEGYSSWSLLAAKAVQQRKAGLWQRLNAGDLVLLGARRGHGKTLCALEIALSAMRAGHTSWFFSLENDLRLFDKALFLHEGRSRLCLPQAGARNEAKPGLVF